MLNLSASAGGPATSGLQQFYQQQQQQPTLPVASAALNASALQQQQQQQQQMAFAAFASAHAATGAAGPQSGLLQMQLLQPGGAALFSPAALQGVPSLQNYQSLPLPMCTATLSSAAAAQNPLLSQLSLIQQLVYPSGLPFQLPLTSAPHFGSQAGAAAGLPALSLMSGPTFVPDLPTPPSAPHILKVL